MTNPIIVYTIEKSPAYEWDDKKAALNLKKHGVAFESVYELDWETVVVTPDTRREYGEIRYAVIGFIKERLHSLIMTKRGETVRVISLRKASGREEQFYDEKTEDS